MLTDETLVAAMRYADPVGAEIGRSRARLLPGYRKTLQGFLAAQDRETLAKHLRREFGMTLKFWRPVIDALLGDE